MKFTIAAITLACAFAAQDTAPPVISLDLTDVHEQYNAAYGSGKTVHSSKANRDSPAGKTKTTPYAANSADRFARKCEVCAGCTTDEKLVAAALDCPSPIPTAYDHHEDSLTNSIQCVAKQYVISEPGKEPYKGNEDATCTGKDGKSYPDLDVPKTVGQFLLSPDAYSKRGEFVLTYDVSDSSNNAAEQLIFAMVMVDTKKPTIAATTTWPNSPVTFSIEACKDITNTHTDTSDRCKAKGFNTATATDTYDGTTAVKYATCTSGATCADVDPVALTDFAIDIKTLGTQYVVLTSSDFADIFGKNNQNNVASTTITITVQDTTPPIQYLLASSLPPKRGSKTMSYLNSDPRVATKVCNAATELATVTTLAKCVEYTATKYVPGVQDTQCVGCDDTKCYSGSASPAGAISCRAVAGSQTETFECGDAAVSAGAAIFSSTGKALATGAYCVDTRDSKADSSNDNKLDALSSTVSDTTITAGKVSSHTITYSCVDNHYADSNSANNKAQDIVRTVNIVDRTAPELYITKNGLRAADKTAASSCTGAKADTNYCVHDDDTQACHDLTNKESGLSTIKDSDEAKCTDNDAWTATINAKNEAAFIAQKDEMNDSVFHSAGYTQDFAMVESLTVANKGYLCIDECNSAPTTTTQWYFCKEDSSDDMFYDCCGTINTDASKAVKKDTFNTLTKGAWAVTYTCSDGSDDSDDTTACRNVKNEDHAKPIIRILDGATKTYEASSTSNYVDAGATCHDEVDGNISENVEVSGDVVNLARVGVYNIYYDCKDSSGNEATKRNRKVTVRTQLARCARSRRRTAKTTAKSPSRPRSRTRTRTRQMSSARMSSTPRSQMSWRQRRTRRVRRLPTRPPLSRPRACTTPLTSPRTTLATRTRLNLPRATVKARVARRAYSTSSEPLQTTTIPTILWI